MSRIIKVEVTEKDVYTHTLQKKKSVNNCPVAMALERATGQKWGVSRSGCFSKAYGRIEFAERVTQWVDALDAHVRVGPIQFTLFLQ